MADWLKVEKNTATKPEVLAIAGILGISPDDAFGKCFRFWSWADSHLTDGNARGVTKLTIDSMIGAHGFASALESVGWLDTSGGHVKIPSFEKHMSESAKKRALTANRVASLKSRHKNGNAEGNATSVTGALPDALPTTRTRSTNQPNKRSTLVSVEVDQMELIEPTTEAVQREADELMRELPATSQDTRFVMQLAWLLAAQAPIANVVRDAVNGVRAMQPDKPISYLNRTISNKLSKQKWAAIRALAPPCRSFQPPQPPPTETGAARLGLTLNSCPPT